MLNFNNEESALTARFAASADDLAVAFTERLAAKRIDDRITGAVEVAEPPTLLTQTFTFNRRFV